MNLVPTQWRDIDALLVVAALALLFVAYDTAGLVLKGWHTISYYASYNAWVKWSIGLAFLIGGLTGFVWFIFVHALPGRILK